MLQNKLKTFLALCGVVIMAGAFAGLGIWQWDRAQLSRQTIAVDSTLVSLESVTQPRIGLPSSAALRYVSVEGRYEENFKAPNQLDAQGGRATWEVGLLHTKSGGVILIARGIAPMANLLNSPKDISVTGILMPHQSDNYAEKKQGVLARLDSALVVDQTNKDIYDGYIIANSESLDGVPLSGTRIDPPKPRTAVPGFYWQHISYVVIWWLMGAIVVFLPFYNRWVRSRVQPGSKVDSQSKESGE
jgi:cytochrome oxidase assembly protein ShyY1